MKFGKTRIAASARSQAPSSETVILLLRARLGVDDCALTSRLLVTISYKSHARPCQLRRTIRHIFTYAYLVSNNLYIHMPI
jgi:hypothetical protein